MNIPPFLRKLLVSLLLLAALPLLVFFCTRSDRPYLITTSVGFVLILAAFFLHFEHRKPQARELVVLAVLSAIAVASRALFQMIPFFKPMLGIIMLSGIAFGPEAGFLVGAVSLFASNFIFGQGSWTPWQMFAYGLGGYLAGLLARIHVLSAEPDKLPVLLRMALVGFLLVVLLIGPLLDTNSLVTMVSDITPESAASIYLSGLPVNLIHGTATALTLLIIGKPLLEKLHRIQRKYGMMA